MGVKNPKSHGLCDRHENGWGKYRRQRCAYH